MTNYNIIQAGSKNVEHCSICNVTLEPWDKKTAYDSQEVFCSECSFTNLIQCECCEELFSNENEMQETQTGFLCNDCFENNYNVCGLCGKIHETESMTWAEDTGNCYCERCASRVLTECDECGSHFYNLSSYYAGFNTHICNSCFENYYTTCDRCDDVIREDNTYSNEDGVYCRTCYELEEENRGLKHVNGYHNGSPVLFDGETWADRETTYIAFENEMDDGQDPGACAKELFELSENETLFHLEHDGSLSDEGFELVTKAYSKIEMIPIDEICRIAKSHGMRSHDTDTCGLHVHFSRSPYRNRIEELENKLIYFYSKYQNEIENFSRRSSNSYARFPNCSDEISENELQELKQDLKYSRYIAVNVSNPKTIEIRCFKGTLNPSTIKATLQFVLFTLELLDKIKIADLRNVEFAELFHGEEVPKELKEYLKKRKLV